MCARVRTGDQMNCSAAGFLASDISRRRAPNRPGKALVVNDMVAVRWGRPDVGRPCPELSHVTKPCSATNRCRKAHTYCTLPWR